MLGAGFRGRDMSGTALWKEGFCGSSLFPMPGLSASVMELVGGA